MTCKESMRSLLALGAANPAVAEHLRECSDCQSAARAANALRLEGDVRRQEEISPRVQRDAHREAVRILEQRRQAKNPFLSPVFAWRAAAVAVPVAAGVMAVVLYLHGDGSPTAALAPSAAPAVATAPARSELEGEIQNRRDAVNEGFRQFQKRYRDTRTASAFDVRSERLRGRMETFSSSIAKELGSAEPKAAPGSSRPARGLRTTADAMRRARSERRQNAMTRRGRRWDRILWLTLLTAWGALRASGQVPAPSGVPAWQPPPAPKSTAEARPDRERGNAEQAAPAMPGRMTIPVLPVPAPSPAGVMPAPGPMPGPIPQMTREVQREREIMGEVFARFPDAEPERMMQFMRETFVREMREFRDLSLDHRDEAVDLLTNLVRQSLELMEIKRRHPALYEQHLKQRRLEREADDIAQAAKRASGEERDKLVASLRQKLEDAFEVKQGLMKSDVEQMETELKDLKAMIEKRQQNREGIIKRRVGEIIGESDYLQW